jgi:membrane protease subunit HflC
VDKYSQTLTADNNMLLTSVYVGWKISDAGQFLQVFPGDSSVSLPNAQSKLEGMLRTAKSAVIGQHPLSDFVNADPKDLKFDAIQNEIEQAVQTELQTNNYGMEIEFLGFEKIGLPESVTQTVFDRMKSERQVLISLAENTGKSEAQKIQSAADAESAKTIANAQATATRIRAEGEAEAAKTLPIFEQNPDLAVFLLRIDAIKQSLNQRSTLFFDERIPPFDLFRNLPTNAPSH